MNELAQIEKVVVLQSADLFSYCKAEEVLRIASISAERRLEPGQQVYGAGDPADVLYCVVRGGVDLDDANGVKQQIGPLGTFGAAEILSGHLRKTTATSTGETLALAIDAEEFLDLLAHSIDIVRALFRHMIHDYENRRESRA